MAIDKTNPDFPMIYEDLVKAVFKCERGGADGMADASFYDINFNENIELDKKYLKTILTKVIEDISENEELLNGMLEKFHVVNQIQDEEDIRNIILETIDLLNINGY